jgi:hypothetical protein
MVRRGPLTRNESRENAHADVTPGERRTRERPAPRIQSRTRGPPAIVGGMGLENTGQFYTGSTLIATVRSSRVSRAQ